MRYFRLEKTGFRRCVTTPTAEAEGPSHKIDSFRKGIFTPLEITVRSQKWRWMEDDVPFQLGDFWVLYVNFPGVYLNAK